MNIKASVSRKTSGNAGRQSRSHNVSNSYRSSPDILSNKTPHMWSMAQHCGHFTLLFPRDHSQQPVVTQGRHNRDLSSLTVLGDKLSSSLALRSWQSFEQSALVPEGCLANHDPCCRAECTSRVEEGV